MVTTKANEVEGQQKTLGRHTVWFSFLDPTEATGGIQRNLSVTSRGDTLLIVAVILLNILNTVTPYV